MRVRRVCGGEACRHERGAVGVMVALLLTVLFGGAAFAVDLGDAWQRKRKLATATDAAALAAAQEYATGADGCAARAPSYLAANDEAASMTACDHTAGHLARSGYVTVDAVSHVDYTFGPVLGLEGQDVHSSTTAGFGVPTGATGLRPIAICESYPDLAAWLDVEAGPTIPSGTIVIPYTKLSLGCDSAPGNWSLLDFDDGGGGADEVSDLLASGFPDTVDIPSLIAPKTGHVSSISAALTALVHDGTVFPVPLFDLVTGTGKDARYRVVAVARVRLIGFDITGPPAAQYLALQFLPGLVSGSCCGDGPDTGARAVSICAVREAPTEGECDV